MSLPHVESFFWCLSVERGAKNIGFLHLITAFIIMIFASIFAVEVRGNMGTVEDVPDGVYSSAYQMAVVVAVGSVVHIILAVTLIYSIFKRKPFGVRVWVLVMVILYILSILWTILQICLKGFSESGSEIFLSFLEGLFAYTFVLYCIICVNTFYMMIKSEEDLKTHY